MARHDVDLERHPGYKHADPFDAGYLPVTYIYKLHYEQYGNTEGKPVIFLHGGPGGRTTKENTQYFDPAIYRVVLLDQRGADKSQPCAELRENNSHLLVDDIERPREHIGIRKWGI
ncbi:Alpha/Beta hydrolase protein [Talaromyces proteolyticus]|uniref:prolyl aminopeptidase n=1 Tax=Talaromyces proteolyticus TaxID=1131652 RepID=A0AAD4KZ61_9EURO|nr:Alpha/Beta hydrolase protein [Talaromyces proteolyticus]KAH8700515.1 Alpha/Beta hydrolase protein [Talaromyces proteolyticus]